MSNKKKVFSSEEKALIIKEHLLDKVPMSELCTKYGLPPSTIYTWQSQLFTNASLAFERKNDAKIGRGASLRYEKKIEELEKKLVQKNEVVSELMEEYVKAKKSIGVT